MYPLPEKYNVAHIECALQPDKRSFLVDYSYHGMGPVLDGLNDGMLKSMIY